MSHNYFLRVSLKFVQWLMRYAGSRQTSNKSQFSSWKENIKAQIFSLESILAANFRFLAPCFPSSSCNEVVSPPSTCHKIPRAFPSLSTLSPSQSVTPDRPTVTPKSPESRTPRTRGASTQREQKETQTCCKLSQKYSNLV